MNISIHIEFIVIVNFFYIIQQNNFEELFKLSSLIFEINKIDFYLNK